MVSQQLFVQHCTVFTRADLPALTLSRLVLQSRFTWQAPAHYHFTTTSVRSPPRLCFPQGQKALAKRPHHHQLQTQNPRQTPSGRCSCTRYHGQTSLASQPREPYNPTNMDHSTPLLHWHPSPRWPFTHQRRPRRLLQQRPARQTPHQRHGNILLQHWRQLHQQDTITIDTARTLGPMPWRPVVCVTLCSKEASTFIHFTIHHSQQGAHGHLDGMGQRRPIQAVVQTYLQGCDFK